MNPMTPDPEDKLKALADARMWTDEWYDVWRKAHDGNPNLPECIKDERKITDLLLSLAACKLELALRSPKPTARRK